MKQSFWKGMGSCVIKGGVELLMGLPLLIMMAVYIVPGGISMWLWFLLLPLCYAAGYTGGSLLSLRKRYQLFLFIGIIGALASFVVFDTSYGFYLGLPIAAWLAARGVKLVTVPWYVLFPVTFYGIALVVYFLCSLIWSYVPILQPYSYLLLWGGLASLAITLLMTNQSNMKQETLSGDKEPVLATAVVWQNRILIFIVMALILIVVMFRKLQQAVIWLKELLLAWLRELLARNPEPPPVDKAEQPPMNLSGLGEGGQAAPWLLWLEKAFMILIETALVLLLLYILYLIVRKLPGLLKALYLKLMGILARKETHKGAGGYEDDVESLMDWKSLRDQLAARLKGWLPHKSEPLEKWEELKDNKEKVRYLYRAWILKAVGEGYQLKRHQTPLENTKDIQKWDPIKGQSPESLISLYEQVRYGGKAAEDREVNDLKKSVEKKQ
ncbi:hypothetical protein [Paenibacillus radicis (ex Xue et al. 2023)]|uniref:DUF4129 domain-containing protein n=1 Tax=Paenibacillus radicis (ex Xue et al. 2023) TaxID=2972489 RepID=A0ABT1YEW1_9BACL|nr:hypothetical protein [Paenibacillus radicis (ex Xue et al. 2023)]MCR8631714.1 hypothetical protein [Paenibacillus radicis (ex Xue et al. 2023)]